MLLNKYLSYVTQEDVETSRPLTLVQLLLPGWWSLLRLMFSSVACHNYLIFLPFFFFFNYLYYFFSNIYLCLHGDKALCCPTDSWEGDFLGMDAFFPFP